MFRRIALFVLLIASALAGKSNENWRISYKYTSIRSFDGPFYDVEGNCKVPKKGRYAVVMAYDKTPPPHEIERYAHIYRLLKVNTTSIAEVVVIVPTGFDQGVVFPPDVNIRLKTMDFPFEASDLPEMSRHDQETKPNCCGWKEMFKLNVMRMTEYHRILFADSDLVITRNPDLLFGCDRDFLFSSGSHSALNGGMWVVRPNMALYNDMKGRALDPQSWDSRTGWFGAGFICRSQAMGRTMHALRKKGEWCPGGNWLEYGYEGVQGFFFAFFNLLKTHWASDPVDPCLFDYVWGHGCTSRTYGRTYIAHKFATSNNYSCTVYRHGCAAVPLLQNGVFKGYRRRPEPHHCKPSFFVMGATNTGAEELMSRLASHPKVPPNPTKKGFRQGPNTPTPIAPRAFARADSNLALYRGDNGSRRLDAMIRWLNSHYGDRFKGKVGDGSPYLSRRNVPVKMLEICPVSSGKFKFVVLLRDPFERLESVFLTDVLSRTTRGAVTPLLNLTADAILKTTVEAIQAYGSDDWIYNAHPLFSPGENGTGPTQLRNPLLDSLYLHYLNTWLSYFEASQFLFVCSEGFFSKDAGVRNTVFGKVQEFIGIDPMSSLSDQPLVLKKEQALLGRGLERQRLDMNMSVYKPLTKFFGRYQEAAHLELDIFCPLEWRCQALWCSYAFDPRARA